MTVISTKTILASAVGRADYSVHVERMAITTEQTEQTADFKRSEPAALAPPGPWGDDSASMTISGPATGYKIVLKEIMGALDSDVLTQLVMTAPDGTVIRGMQYRMVVIPVDGLEIDPGETLHMVITNKGGYAQLETDTGTGFMSATGTLERTVS